MEKLLMSIFSQVFGNSLIFFRFPKFLFFVSSSKFKTQPVDQKIFSISDLKFHHKNKFIKTEASEAVV